MVKSAAAVLLSSNLLLYLWWKLGFLDDARRMSLDKREDIRSTNA
jgi:hypothetical protein